MYVSWQSARLDSDPAITGLRQARAQTASIQPPARDQRIMSESEKNTPSKTTSSNRLLKDISSALVVFLVALPLCLGIALASGAPLVSGVLAGIIGGIVVGTISGSHTSVSGPAAGLAAVVIAQIAAFDGDFSTFLLAVFVAGIMQVLLGVFKAGSIAAFFPSSVIKGLLAAIGIILILKQIPHLFGYVTPEDAGMSPLPASAFPQNGRPVNFGLQWFLDTVHFGATAIGFTSLMILIANKRIGILKKVGVPGPLLAVAVGTLMKFAFDSFGTAEGGIGKAWRIGSDFLVQIPVAETFAEFGNFLDTANFSAWSNPLIYSSALTIALVASLETLLNLEAVDRLDKKQRNSPPNRELVAQGVGNMCAGLVGAIPVTSVIIRSSVNIDSGGETKRATIIHGFLLLGCGMFFPYALNQIPLSCLAAILLMTGFKLASPELLVQMWKGGKQELIPFLVTVIAIVVTDLLSGILIGLGLSLLFILYGSLKHPLRKIWEKHVGGDVLRIELPNQLTFLNRAALSHALVSAPDGSQVLLDARNTNYIDPDVRVLIDEFQKKTAPAHNISLSMLGFRDSYLLNDKIQYVDYSSRDVQENITPAQALQVLLDGNERFRTGHQLTRTPSRQVVSTAQGQFPLAVVLTCIDSRTPAETIFDMGIGDIFSVRVAGNVVSSKVLGSMEYGCAQAGSKLLIVVGHTRCGAVQSTVELAAKHQNAREATGCENLDSIVREIEHSVDPAVIASFSDSDKWEKEKLLNLVSRSNVLRTVDGIRRRSSKLRQMESDAEIAIVAAMYDVTTGKVEVLKQDFSAVKTESGERRASSK